MNERVNSFIGFLFVGSGGVGIIDWFVDFSDKYFIALSCAILIITSTYKFVKWIKGEKEKRMFKK
jgi:hypothetical protein